MRSPVVEIDAGSGFCHGVVSAIRKAEEELARSGQLACLGDIVHNSDEVERLRQKGLDTITHDDLSRMSHCKVLLRAHGEPPSTYKTARERDIEIVDATCPVVLQLQRRIKKNFRYGSANNSDCHIRQKRSCRSQWAGRTDRRDGDRSRGRVGTRCNRFQS